MRLALNAALPTRILAGGALAFALAGCAGFNSQGTFGAPGTTVDPAAAASVSPSGTTVAGSEAADATQVTCPPASVRSGASAWQVPAPGGGLRAQGTLGNLARECNVANGVMTIKVGIEGRVLLGEKGTPGAFSVPIRVALVAEGPNPKTIQTKFFTVPVQVPPNETQAGFAVVEDGLVLPMPPKEKWDELDRYIIYVGFDSKGEPAARTRPSTTPRPATPRPAAAAPAAAPAASAPATAPATTRPAAGDTGAPKGDTFGPAPTFAPPPPSGTVGPTPNTFGPVPSQ